MSILCSAEAVWRFCTGARAVRSLQTGVFGGLSRALCVDRRMDISMIGHFRPFEKSLGKSTRGNGRRNGHACAVKRVFKSMAMPQNDDHFEARDLLHFLDFSHFACSEIVCAEAVLMKD